MFGHKNARLMETELRSQAREDAVKSTQASHKSETWIAKNRVEALARKEMYFAVGSIFRWSQ